MYAFFSEKKNSQSNTPASTSTSAIIPVNECLCLMLADEIKKKYNTAELINFLHKKDLGLDKDDFAVKRLADFARKKEMFIFNLPQFEGGVGEIRH